MLERDNINSLSHQTKYIHISSDSEPKKGTMYVAFHFGSASVVFSPLSKCLQKL